MESVIGITYFELVPNTLFFTIPLNHERIKYKHETKKRDFIELKNEIVTEKMNALTKIIRAFRTGVLEMREIGGIERIVVPANVDSSDIEEITAAMKKLVSDEITLIGRGL